MIRFDAAQMHFLKHDLFVGTNFAAMLENTDDCCFLNKDEIEKMLTVCENTEAFLENELQLSTRIRNQSDLTQKLIKTREIKEKLKWNCFS